MAKYTALNMNNVTISASGLKMVKPPALSFKVEFELDKKIEKEAAKDPLLQQEFKNAAQAVYDQTVKNIEQKCKAFDKAFVEMSSKGAKPADMEKQLKGLNDSIKNDMKVAEKGAEQAILKAWSDLAGKRKEWKTFKIKVFATIAGTLAGLAVSIAAMASSPFSGGAGAAFGIIGFVKSGVTLAGEIAKIAIDINGAKVVVEKNLAVVEAAAKNKGVYTLNEVSAAVFNEFLGISQPSVKTCQSSCDTLKAKYAQMVVKVHDLSKTLDKILKEQEKLKKEFMAEVAKRLKNHPTPNKGAQVKIIEKQLDDALSGNYSKVMTTITKIHTLYDDTKSWDKPVKDLSDRVNQLSIKDPKALKVFREALKFCMLATAPIDGNQIATKAKDLGMGLGGAAGGYVYDKICSKAIDGTVFDV
jgi:hypothetical protein